MRHAILITLLALGLASNHRAAADEIIDQIDIGKSYYLEGDLARALSEFEFAVNAIRTAFSESFIRTLPEPPIFWSAEPAALESTAAIFGSGIMVTRQYKEEKGDGRITAELMVDSPMVQAFSAVFNSPVMIASSPNMERVRIDGMTALLKWDDGNKAGELSVAVGGRVLAKLVGYDLKDKSILVELMRAWDLNAVKTVVGL